MDLAQDLVQVLRPFYEITLQVSTGASTRLAEVVVFIDQVTADLSTIIANNEDNYPPALRNACRAGLKITNKYYSLTDCSPMYRIAMSKHISVTEIVDIVLTFLLEHQVLHPSFKDEYFKLAKWPKSWIDEAIDLTREMYDTWYKPKNRESAQRPPRKGPPKVCLRLNNIGRHLVLTNSHFRPKQAFWQA